MRHDIVLDVSLPSVLRQVYFLIWARFYRFCAWLGSMVGFASHTFGGVLRLAFSVRFGAVLFSCRSTQRAYASLRTRFDLLRWTTSRLAPGGSGWLTLVL